VEAVLLHHPADAEWACDKLGAKVELIAHDDWIRLVLNAPSMQHFFSSSDGSNKMEEEVKHLVLNWHRDGNGRDLAFKNGVSLAQVISGSAMIAIPSYYREYYTLKRWLEKFDCIYISRNEHPRFLAVASKFADQIRFYDPGHNRSPLGSSCYDRVLGHFPIISPKSTLAHFAQRPFRSFLGSCNLFFNDWTLSILAGKCANTLLVGGRNPLKAAYLNTGNIRQAERMCPEELDAPYHLHSLQQVLSRIGVHWDVALLQLISDYLRKAYQLNRDYFIRVIAIYQRLFRDYCPKRVIIPGEAYEPYTIALQLARARELETVLVGDGYTSVMHPGVFPIFLNENGTGWLIEKFAAFGHASWDHLKHERNLTDASLFLMRPPLLDRHKNLYKPTKKYEVMIMSWIAWDLNPQGFQGWQIRCVVNTLEALVKAGYKKIALKLKAESQKRIFEPILKQFGWMEKVTILTGMFHEHVLKAEKIIGGFSTGLLEAAFHNIPYFVYEPFENGYSDQTVNSSRLVNPSLVSRTTNQLLACLNSGESSVSQTLGYLIDGPVTPPWG
jgi:hypothetical protein